MPEKKANKFPTMYYPYHLGLSSVIDVCSSSLSPATPANSNAITVTRAINANKCTGCFCAGTARGRCATSTVQATTLNAGGARQSTKSTCTLRTDPNPRETSNSTPSTQTSWRLKTAASYAQTGMMAGSSLQTSLRRN